MERRPLQMPGGFRTGRSLRLAGLILLVLAAVVGRRLSEQGGSDQEQRGPDQEQIVADQEQRVLDLFQSRRSGEMVTVQGVVDRVLADDNDGSRHQRFIVRLPSGHTLMVAHNIDLADRVPLRAGDAVRIHGQYEWNEQGGVLHWTHDDPDGEHEGGWIEAGGDRYR